MRLSKKTSNRKHAKKQALNVLAREKHPRSPGIRMVSTALAVSFATVVMLFFVWRTGEWMLNRFLFDNDWFAAQVIDIDTDGALSTNDIRSWANFNTGDNLLQLDLSQIKWNLETIPGIREVEVERVLPNRMNLRIRERVPVARIRAFRSRSSGGVEQVIFLCDAEGYLMRLIDAAADPVRSDLPFLKGVESRELREGSQLSSSGARAALQLVAQFKESPMNGVVSITLVEASSAELLTVKTDQGSLVTLEMQGLPRQLLRWRTIYDHGRSEGRVVGSLDLSLSTSIPVRWVEPNPQPSRSDFGRPPSGDDHSVPWRNRNV